jgi:hypothetical protein
MSLTDLVRVSDARNISGNKVRYRPSCTSAEHSRRPPNQHVIGPRRRAVLRECKYNDSHAEY